MHGGTVGTDPVAGQSQRGRRRGQPAAAVPILQVGEQKWHRCRALLGRLAALRQALLSLAEDGCLELGDPAEKLVPEVKLIKGYKRHTPFTLAQLASHTSGLAREPNAVEPRVAGLRSLVTSSIYGYIY